MLSLAGKKALIMGVANDKSIAWGIAQQLHKAGATLGFTYAGDALKKRVEPLAAEVGSTFVHPCDVADDTAIAALADTVKASWGQVDMVVHAIAFSDKDELRGRFMNTTKANFATTLDVSCYSLIAVAKALHPVMAPGGSLLTLTYYGAEKVVPNYNVMGVAKAALEASVRYLAADWGPDGLRVNALSAGPIRTLAASGIGDFRKMLSYTEANAPLRRNVSLEDVGKTALWLLSDLGSGVTGDVVHVDSGFHAMGTAVNLGADPAA